MQTGHRKPGSINSGMNDTPIPLSVLLLQYWHYTHHGHLHVAKQSLSLSALHVMGCCHADDGVGLSACFGAAIRLCWLPVPLLCRCTVFSMPVAVQEAYGAVHRHQAMSLGPCCAGWTRQVGSPVMCTYHVGYMLQCIAYQFNFCMCGRIACTALQAPRAAGCSDSPSRVLKCLQMI